MLEPGTKLAHYEIVELIGQGGMGEVYRAEDLELRQTVALKLLPEELARDEARLSRLRDEVRIAYVLNRDELGRAMRILREALAAYPGSA